MNETYTVEKISKFLEKKNINWYKNLVLDKSELVFRQAYDSDFRRGLVNMVKFGKKENELKIKVLLVTKDLFVILDNLSSKLENDFSNEWKSYLATVAQQKDKKQLEEKFNSFKKDLEADDFDDLTK